MESMRGVDDEVSENLPSPEASSDLPDRASTWVDTPMRGMWLAVGFICIALGTLGVALPLLPTTPFLLLAAFAFARSSRRWHDWLCQHRTFGPMIDDWRQHGAISRKAKFLGVISMLAAFTLSIAMQLSTTVLILQAIALSGAAAFVLSRPSAGN